MRNYLRVTTLAFVGALALTMLLGVLLPSDNVVHAADPEFVADVGTRSVPENTPPGVNIGDPISATDDDETGDDAIEFGNTLTYSLSGTDAASFDIDPSTGQLITKAPLDEETKSSYSVTVTVDDGTTTVDESVAITVADEDEPPAAPFPPMVVSGPDTENTDDNESTTSLKVVWHEPENTGPAITGYVVQYKKTTETSFSPGGTPIATARTTTIPDLDADTSYQVRVRATNGEADTTENWSLVGTGSTNKGNNKPPMFIDDGAVITRDVDENEEVGQDVGRPVRATDDGVLPLTYRLEGPDADLFDFNPSSSQIRTKRGVTYNHEDPECGYVDTATTTECAYYVTVVAFDGAGGSDAKAVEIEIDDVPEAPGVPRGITVRATANNSRSLDVSWNEPENMGPPITGYDVRYRQGSSGSFITLESADTTLTIAPMDTDLSDGDDRLTPGASYEVYVRAKTNELDSQFSARATGNTSAGNRQPKFNARPDQENRRPEFAIASDDTRVVNRAVNENTRTGQPVGGVVSANDRDTLTYNLIADTVDTDDVDKFDINKSTGQILTKDPLNHEDATATGCEYDPNNDPTVCTYKVQVEVWDGLDEHGNEEDSPAVDDIIKVTIEVVDRPESPLAPTVTVTSPEVAEDATDATLTVTWNAPANMSTVPPLTSYEVECSGAGITTSNPCPQPTGLTLTDPEQDFTITDLTPGSSYTVRVRAVNNEGVGAWSTSVRQSTSKAGNVIPTVSSFPSDLQVAENTPAGRSILSVGTPNESRVEADNSDGDLRVTYRLDGLDAGAFTIDGTGQIKTKSPLNFEEKPSYNVRVKVSDNDGGSIFGDVPITVTNVDEPPSAPGAPTVRPTMGSGWSLEVTWSEPRNTGPAITDYDIRYRKVGDAAWQNWPHETDGGGNTERKTTITTILDSDNASVHLEPRVQYEVEVRAKNGEGDGAASPADADNWSRPGRGTTGQSNTRPVFANTASLVTLRVDENTRSGQTVGGAVEATDTDRNRLTYSLEGPGEDSFTIVSTSGQIRTRSALDYESRQRYSLTVKVNDGQRRDNSVAVKSVAIIVGDVDERPSAPSAPRVTGIAGSTDSVRVTWDEPANTGPPIIDYDVRCLTCPGDVSHDGADRSTIITGLTPGTRYAVEVRANNGELTGEWSRSGTGSPNPDVANQRPVFSPSGARSFEIAENATAGDPIGDPVSAVDPDLDPVTHTLEGADATSFDIDPGSGQIRANAELNHEQKSRHSVTVKATDTRGGSATVAVTITVTDVDEPPSIPSSPTVTAVSSTSLQVSWVAPDNTGPPITDYDYRYRDASAQNWTEVTNTTITATAVTIDDLTPSTFYDVSVRATNAEGTSDWSIAGNGETNAPGANNLPVFSEGTSATRNVSASATPGTNIGDPVSATDADSGDTLTYRLEGRDAPFFDIDTSNGQLRTRTGITLIVGTTYTVTVVADDTKDRAEITVTIEATAAPPNAVPAFAEGTATTRSVFEGTPAGTNIGSPVRATDADTGDTVTYSLEGTDAAAFAIVPSSGQIQTRAALNVSTKATYTFTVVASDGKARATITVTITVAVRPNSPPVFSDGVSTSRSVVEPVAPFTEIGSPVVATDADDDTLTYTLGGTDAASFFIDLSSGQLFTRIALTVDTRSTYTVTVVASDAEASARITVTINVLPPPNIDPVFSQGPSTTRTVRDDARSGANIGGPVTATDADAGDTITYSLEGTDAASFAIVASSGQIQARAALDASRKSTYSVTVRATDSRGGSATIAVTITVTARPATFGCATLGAVSDTSNTGLVSDCEALMASRNILEGSTGRLNWAPARPINQWDGVVLNGTPARVTAVVLRSQGLNGSIPADLGQLDRLVQLNLRSNELSGSIPDEIGNLTNLQWLFLHNNRLSGDFPNLSRLSNLTRLWLSGSNNRIGAGNGIPPWLNGMSNLQELNLWGNQLGGEIPNLSGMTSLNLLKLQHNSLTGTIPSSFGNMSSLGGLYLHNNNLSGAIPSELGQLTGLVRLWLDRNDLNGNIPSELGNMSSLRTLNLHGNQLTGSIPAQLGNLSSLNFLAFHNNRRVDANGTVLSSGLTGTIPSELGNLSALIRLALSNNSLTGTIPSELGDLDRLRLLWLSQNQLSGAIPSGLGDLGDTLSNIRLADNSFDANTCVPRALSNVATNDYSEAGLSICSQ